MADKDLGIIGIVPKGQWVSGTPYEFLNLVTDGGNSYVSRKNNNTSALTVEADWMLMSTGGKDFKFSDFTQAQLDSFKQPAIDAATIATTAAGNADTATDLAVQATQQAVQAVGNTIAAIAAAENATENADEAAVEALAAKDAANQAAENALSGIKGTATPTTVPSATGFERWLVHTAGTYTNFSGIVVSAADLDIVNGVANNRVILEVSEGVATKRVERVKGDKGMSPYDVAVANGFVGTEPEWLASISAINAVNKVANGDFGQSQTNWTFGGQKHPSIDTGISLINSNSLKIDTTAQSSVAYQDLTFPNGHIVYYAVNYNLQSWTAGSSVLSIYNFGSYAGTKPHLITASPTGVWRRSSGIITVSGGGFRMGLGSTGSLTMVANLDGAIAINLTELFGAGNEPTLQDFEDNYLISIPNYWFDKNAPLISLRGNANSISQLKKTLTTKVDGTTFTALDMFSKKDIITYPALTLFKSLSFTLQPTVNNISLIQLYVATNKLYVIFNINGLTTGSNYTQQITCIADVASSPETVTITDQTGNTPFGLSSVSFVFDFAKYTDSMAISNAATATDKRIFINQNYVDNKTLKPGSLSKVVADVEVLKNGSVPSASANYPTLKTLIAGVTNIGDHGYVGDLKFKRIANGTTEAAFKRCFHYKTLSEPKFKVADVAAALTRNTIDIDKQGRIRAFGSSDGKLYYASDFSALKANNYTVLADLRAMNPEFIGVPRNIYQLEDNKLMIVNPTTEGNIGGIFILDMTNNTLVKTLTYRNEYIWTVTPWSVVIRNKTILLSEYGNSLTNPAGIGQKADATKIWKSTDNGSTWVELYDFRNTPNIVPDGFHIHAMHYDAFWNRLWVTTGDVADLDGVRSSKRLFWSDDEGATFKSLNLALYFGSTFNALNNAQGLSMFAANDFLLIGGDDYNNGIYRVAKIDKNATPVLELVHQFDTRYNDRVTQFTGQWMRLSNGLIVTVLKNGDSTPRTTKIIGTYDGFKWFDVWAGEETLENIGSNDCIMTELDGYLYLQYRGKMTPSDTLDFKFIKLEIPQGIQGIQGETGPQGIQGPAGADGQDGQQGPPGADGQDGQDGMITGAATETNSPIMTGFHRYTADVPLTAGSAWGEVTQAELDENWVIFNVQDGVITKTLKPLPAGGGTDYQPFRDSILNPNPIDVPITYLADNTALQDGQVITAADYVVTDYIAIDDDNFAYTRTGSTGIGQFDGGATEFYDENKNLLFPQLPGYWTGDLPLNTPIDFYEGTKFVRVTIKTSAKGTFALVQQTKNIDKLNELLSPKLFFKKSGAKITVDDITGKTFNPTMAGSILEIDVENENRIIEKLILIQPAQGLAIYTHAPGGQVKKVRNLVENTDFWQTQVGEQYHVSFANRVFRKGELLLGEFAGFYYHLTAPSDTIYINVGGLFPAVGGAVNISTGTFKLASIVEKYAVDFEDNLDLQNKIYQIEGAGVSTRESLEVIESTIADLEKTPYVSVYHTYLKDDTDNSADFIDAQSVWTIDSTAGTATTSTVGTHAHNASTNALRLNRIYEANKREASFVMSFAANSIFDIVTANPDGQIFGYRIFRIDVPNKKLIKAAAENSNTKEETIPFDLVADKRYIIRVGIDRLTEYVSITDEITGETFLMEIPDTGNSSKGNYNVVLMSGGAIKLHEVDVAIMNEPDVFIAGDSIVADEASEVTGWAYKFTDDMKGAVVISARGSSSSASLPYLFETEIKHIKPKVFMWCHGHNGAGIVLAELDAMKALCDSIGTIMYVNHMTCKGGDGHIAENNRVEQRGFRGARFDIATARDGNPYPVSGDAAIRANSALYRDGFIHPNAAGNAKMYERLRIDLPELYK